MEQKESKKYQIIGACISMQRVSWETEIELMKGIVYDIDFYLDFSSTLIDETPIGCIPITDIIEAIIYPRETDCTTQTIPTREELRKSHDLWKEVEKIVQKEHRREKKWERKHPRPKTNKEAYENFEWAVGELMR